MEAKFSNRVKEVISLSREEAIRLGHDYIGTEHLLLGIIREGEGTALTLLRKLGVSLDELKFSLEQATRNTASPQGTSITGSIPLTKATEKVLKVTYLEAKIFKAEVIGTEHLLLSILRDEDNISSQILSKFSVNYESARDSLDYHGNAPLPPTSKKKSPDTDDDDNDRLFGGGQGRSGAGQQGGAPRKAGGTGEKSRTPVLDNFGRDLTKMAEDDKLDPIVGREKEIERVPKS